MIHPVCLGPPHSADARLQRGMTIEGPPLASWRGALTHARAVDRVLRARALQGLAMSTSWRRSTGRELIPDRPHALRLGGVAHDQVGGLAAQRFGRRLEERLIVAPAAGLDIG